MLDIVAALRVKNEARWIEEVLNSISFCKKIYLLDDHSTDDTKKIAKRCGATIYQSSFKTLDEARDKEYLLSIILSEQPQGTWVLMIDGDEVLMDNGEKLIEQSIRENPKNEAFSVRILYLWNSQNMVRVDGVYGRFVRPSIFKLGRSRLFRKTKNEGHLHCSSVPHDLLSRCIKCRVSYLHLGYMNREDRIKKWEYYNSIDPRDELEGYDKSHCERGSYPHIVQGDIEVVPANAVLKHGGPLKLVPIESLLSGNRKYRIHEFKDSDKTESVKTELTEAIL